MSIKKIGMSALLIGSGLIAGCGSGSSGNSSTSYLTYYNLSSNVASVKLYDDDTWVTNVSYESTSSRRTLESGTSTIELKVDKTDDTTETLYSKDLNLTKNKLNFLISIGKLELDGEDEPLFFSFESKEIDDEKFQFNVMNLAQEFKDKTITLTFVDTEDGEIMNSFDVAYGESKSVTIDDDAESYYIKLFVDGETDASLTTSAIAFGATQYFFAIKDSTLNNETIPSLARLISSFSSTAEYKDSSLKSYVRFYNSADLLEETSLFLDDSTDENSVPFYTLTPGELAATSVEVSVGTSPIALKDSNGDNVLDEPLYSFYSGEDKTVVFYRNDEDEDNDGILDILNLSFSNTSRPITNNHQITFVNLLNNQGDDEVDLYFVPEGETFENSNYRVTQQELGDISRFAIPSDTYDIYLTVDRNDRPVVIAQIRGAKFDTELDVANKEFNGDWILFAEPQADEESGPTYRSPAEIVLRPMNPDLD